MMMKTLKCSGIAFAMLATLASCSSDAPVGKWDAMVWKAEVPVRATDGVYTVPEAGAEFTFTCQNYSSPWIENALSGGNYYFPQDKAGDFHHISAGWFRAEMSGKRLTVVFEANETAEERLLTLTVTAGDIFHTFRFKQLANK
ncbi:MAG: BACON domain-containing protein [Prevotella sp.]|nr:BACON domain-containing protein [Prevotella sp.]